MTDASGSPVEGSFKRYLRYYPLIFLVSTLFALFSFSQDLTQSTVSHTTPPSWWPYLPKLFVGVYTWALLTPGILWLGLRFPIERRNWLRPAMIQLVLSACVSAVELILETTLYAGLHLIPSAVGEFGSVLAQSLIKGIHGGMVDYWIVLEVQWGAIYYRRYQQRSQDALKLELRASELQSQLVSAQLTALKMQLQPHFLFNTLNAIIVLVRQQKAKDAEQMLGYLSDLLRGVLQDVDAQEVALRRELEYLQLYLSIERVRFADRLSVEISADPAAQQAYVPQLVLQPIVENAIRHGIGQRSGAGRILISTAKTHGLLQIRVQDDGPGLSTSYSPEHEGIGLANTRARLRQLYGKDGSLEIENCPGGGAVVTMKLPFRDSPAETVSTYASHNADRG